MRAVQISEIVDGKSMTEAFYKINASCSTRLCPLPESLYKKPKASMSFSCGPMGFFIPSGHGVPFSVIAGDERSIERALQSEFFML